MPKKWPMADEMVEEFAYFRTQARAALEDEHFVSAPERLDAELRLAQTFMLAQGQRVIVASIDEIADRNIEGL